MAKVTVADLELLKEFRNAGILEDVNPSKIKGKGVILVCCSDGDQMHDIFTHQVRIIEVIKPGPRIHTIAMNGGALLLPRDSPLSAELHEDEVMLWHIAGARKLKDIHTVVLYAHAPCGAAGLANLTLLKVIELLIQAAKRLNTIYAQLQVIPMFHVDYDGKKKRSYFLSIQKWNEWIASK